MPVVRHGGYDAVDLFVVEQVLVASRDGRVILEDLLRQSPAAFIKVAGSNALDAGQLDGSAQQSCPSHADADHSETNRVTGCNRPIAGTGRRGLRRSSLQQEGASGHSSADGAHCALDKVAAGKPSIFHGLSLLARTMTIQLCYP